MGMDYLEQAKKDIRNRWFENHTIKSIEGAEGFQRISWGEKGTRMYQIDYVLSNNMVFVTGDLGSAVYELTCKATLDKIEDFDLSYFTGKLSANKRDKYSFNNKLARKEIKDYFLDWCDVEDIGDLNHDNQDLLLELMNEALNWSDSRGFEHGVFEIYNNTDVDWFDSETASCIADCGKELSYSVIAYWVGLQMIIEQLEAEKE